MRPLVAWTLDRTLVYTLKKQKDLPNMYEREPGKGVLG